MEQSQERSKPYIVVPCVKGFFEAYSVLRFGQLQVTSMLE